MENVLDLLDDHMYVVVVFLICVAALLGSVVRAVTSIIATHCRERSRREIAAYIAEGSLTPEQGERLLRADINAEARHG
jgi:hypothetical protein